MRVGKKLKVVETKRTRSCVVRLEKVRTPLFKPTTRRSSGQNAVSAGSSKSKVITASQKDDDNSKGTLKKRPGHNAVSAGSSKSKVITASEQDDDNFKGTLKKRSLIAQTLTTPAPKTKDKPSSDRRVLKMPATSVVRTIKLCTTPALAKTYKTPEMPTVTKPTKLEATPVGKVILAKTPKISIASRVIPTLKISSPPRVIPIPKNSATSKPSATSKTSASSKLAATQIPNIDLEKSSTIAAGRSRRAIKPNPKYASDDIITPKVVRHVTQQSTPSSRKTIAGAVVDASSSTSVYEKRRKMSTSSSEDLYNKDSSDAEFDDNFNKKEDSDSDYSDFEMHEQESRAAKGRARQIQLDKKRLQNKSPTNIKAGEVKSTPVLKSASTQLQQLRKSIAAANAARLAVLKAPSSTKQAATVTKRKLAESNTDSDSDNAAKRRKIYGGLSTKKDTPPSTPLPINTFPLNHKTLMSRKFLMSTTINGSKVGTGSSTKSNSESVLEKRKVLLERPTTNKPVVKTLLSKTTQNLIDPSKTSAKSIIKQSAIRQRTASPAVTATTKVKENESLDAPKPEPVASVTIDDFETMPTFTIVNINDIINKKGDVLTSSNANLSISSTKSATKNYDTDSSEAEEAHMEKTPIETKSSRRKAVHTKILSEKTETALEKMASPANTPANTPPTKKPAQTILNHTLSSKNASKATNPRATRTSNTLKLQSSSSKPAPRILNSMVAKKTQPVKPMIANLDDSADETYPSLPFDDDDSVESDEEEDDVDDASFMQKPSALLSKKSPLVGTKENSLAATNRHMSAAKAAPIKVSPEKVVISRQGDKIVKKITCFETWYIINVPEEDYQAEVVRNQLDMPLIKLANGAKKVDLPTTNWSSKVTLYHLPPTALSKSNYITYTGEINDQHIPEEDRAQYQPSCVMFRRSVSDRIKSRLPYDRAVIFKNKTFFTNIDGKNVKLVGAPFKISTLAEVEILLQLVDELTLQSTFVEQTATVQ